MVGHLGKEKMQVFGFLSYTRQTASKTATFALLLLSLAGCSGAPQTFTGQLEPISGTCDDANRATLQRHGAIVQFTPQDGVLTLDGTVSSAGEITAVQQTLGMDRKPYRLMFTGVLAGTVITGQYVTPRCRYRVSLQQAGSS
jgi:hypothetical protein